MSVARVCTSLLVTGSLLLAGCAAPAPETPPPPGSDPADGLALVAELAPADAATVGAAVNRFGFDLLGEVASGEENAVTSPLSAATLLAMVLAGAGGDTGPAMAQALHLDDPRDVRVGALLDAVADTDDVTLSVANGLWADNGIPFEEDYIRFVRDSFGATLETGDLAAPATAEEIDAWVRDRTQGLIDQIAADLGLPNPDTALVLLNAVHFLGEWTTQFEPADTSDAPFTLPDGNRVQTPLMHLYDQELAYVERDGYRMLRLPYGQQGRYGMEVILPAPEVGLGTVLGSLDASEWAAAVESLAARTVDELALPRFTLEWDATLNDPLERLGMGPALDPAAADFTPMSPADLFLEVVVQKTVIRVDEAGTEAAAVTGGGMGITSAQPGLTFRVDRPFAFTISDSQTGTILFLGAVADPRG